MLSGVWIFATPWTAACQASLSITNSLRFLKLMYIDSVMPSNHLILCRSFSCPQFPPASGSFPVSQLFKSAGQSIGTSASASVLPMNIQGWFPLGLTGLISLQSKGLSRVFSSTIVQKHQFFGLQPSLWSSSHIHAWLLEKPYCKYSDFKKQHKFIILHLCKLEVSLNLTRPKSKCGQTLGKNLFPCLL